MKTIKFLIILIIILAIIFGIKFSGIFKNKDKLTLEEVKEIVAKSEKIDNYICEYKIDEQNIIRKHNGNKEFLKIDEKKYYIDYEKNETIGIIEDSKKAIVMDILSEEIIKSKMEKFKLLLEEKEEYNYIGEEIYNGINCIVIEINYKNEVVKKIWIAKEEGVILKILSKSGNEETIEEYKFEFNCVSDEEVRTPDLSGYQIIETN